MTTVAEAINAGGPTAAWAYVQDMAQKVPGWLLLQRRAVFAECLLDTCTDMGLLTLADVDAFVRGCGLTKQQVEGLFPVVLLAGASKVAASELNKQAGVQFTTTRRAQGDYADFKLLHNDAEYEQVPAASVPALAATFPWRSAELAKKKACEHLVTLLKAWTIQQRYEGRAVGLAGFDVQTYTAGRISHAVPVMFCDDGKYRLLDRGQSLPAGHSRFFGAEGFAARLRWLQF